jgi:arginase family enzyme
MDAVRVISIGGDHTISEWFCRCFLLPGANMKTLALPILRALHSTWGRVAVLHFDSHLDTWQLLSPKHDVGLYANQIIRDPKQFGVD